MTCSKFLKIGVFCKSNRGLLPHVFRFHIKLDDRPKFRKDCFDLVYSGVKGNFCNLDRLGWNERLWWCNLKCRKRALFQIRQLYCACMISFFFVAERNFKNSLLLVCWMFCSWSTCKGVIFVKEKVYDTRRFLLRKKLKRYMHDLFFLYCEKKS